MPLRFLAFLVSVLAIRASALAAEPAEFHLRGGLPNVAAKTAAGREVRVAFLGGSITAADGWRVFILDRLRREYPRVDFVEIFAAVSGTGSNYGATRLQRDVLRHRPDLLFVEFAVNDGAGSPQVEAQIEGIVRQAWAADPRTDVCFVYTVSENSVQELRAGRYQSAARSMEAVAAHYEIPSFNFGVEVARRLAGNTLVMSAPASVKADVNGRDAAGRLIFTRDKTHPTEAGHQLYTERLWPALQSMLRAGSAGAHALRPPRSPTAWAPGRLLTVAEVQHDDSWQPLPPDDPHVTQQKGEGLVPPTWFASEPGAALEFRFKGTVFGLVGLKGSDNGQFRVTIDNQPPETGTLFDAYSTPGRYVLKTWFYHRELADTEHRVRVELLAATPDKARIMQAAGTPIADFKPYAVNGLYVSGLLIVGEPVDTKPAPAAAAAVSPPALTAGEPPPGYVLAWSDEFDGAALDRARWAYRTGERYWSTQLPENVSVHDGCLWLTGKKETRGRSDYTAGGVISRRAFRYGYYEARFKVPPAKGWHTSFWLMRNAEANAAAHDGSRLEIDICENDSIHPTRYAVNLHQWLPEHRGFGQKSVATPDESADFHVWSCEFTPEKIVFYFDGRPVQTTSVKHVPNHGDMSIWLTTIAAPLGRTDAVDDTALPVHAVFDYVRYYERRN